MSTHSRTNSNHSSIPVASSIEDKMTLFSNQPLHHSHTSKVSSRFHTSPPFRTTPSKLPKNLSLRHSPTNSSKSASNPSYECSHCPYSTDRKNNLKRHLATMHEASAKSLECCELRFVSKSSLRDHVNKCHAQGAGYACASCGRRFSRKALMRRHATVHNGERPHACPSCEYATSHRSNLDRHVRRHQLLDGNVRRRCCDQAVSSYKFNVGFAKRSHHGGIVWNQIQDPSKQASFGEREMISDNKRRSKSGTENLLEHGDTVPNDIVFKIDENSNNFKTRSLKESDSVTSVSRVDCNGMLLIEHPTQCDTRDKLSIVGRLGRVKKQRNNIGNGNRPSFQSRYYNNNTDDIIEHEFVRQTKEINKMTSSWMTSSCLSPFSFLYDSYLRYFMPSPSSWPLLQMNPIFPIIEANVTKLFEPTVQHRSNNDMNLFGDDIYRQSSEESSDMTEQQEELKMAQLKYLTLHENNTASKRFSLDEGSIKDERNSASRSHPEHISFMENNSSVRPSSEWNGNIVNSVSDYVLTSSLAGADVNQLIEEGESIVVDAVVRSRPRMRLAPECHRCSVCNVSFKNQLDSELHGEQLHR